MRRLDRRHGQRRDAGIRLLDLHPVGDLVVAREERRQQGVLRFDVTLPQPHLGEGAVGGAGRLSDLAHAGAQRLLARPRLGDARRERLNSLRHLGIHLGLQGRQLLAEGGKPGMRLLVAGRQVGDLGAHVGLLGPQHLEHGRRADEVHRPARAARQQTARLGQRALGVHPFLLDHRYLRRQRHQFLGGQQAGVIVGSELVLFAEGGQRVRVLGQLAAQGGDLLDDPPRGPFHFLELVANLIAHVDVGKGIGDVRRLARAFSRELDPDDERFRVGAYVQAVHDPLYRAAKFAVPRAPGSAGVPH